MKSVILLLAIVTGPTAFADIVKCVFTEPFINTQYSMVQQKLTSTDISNSVKVKKNVSFQIKGAGHFELLDKNNKLVMKLILNYSGSDGMSDFIFPYEATYMGDPNFPNGIVGGCESNFLKKTGSP